MGQIGRRDRFYQSRYYRNAQRIEEQVRMLFSRYRRPAVPASLDQSWGQTDINKRRTAPAGPVTH